MINKMENLIEKLQQAIEMDKAVYTGWMDTHPSLKYTLEQCATDDTFVIGRNTTNVLDNILEVASYFDVNWYNAFEPLKETDIEDTSEEELRNLIHRSCAVGYNINTLQRYFRYK